MPAPPRAPAPPPPVAPAGPGAGSGPSLGRVIGGWVLVIGLASIVFIPQLITYKVLGGRFAPSSTVGDKLDWLAPHALEVLFSPAYGLIPWAPVVLPALAGLVILSRRGGGLALALGVAFLAQVYVAGSYSTWMAASSFGQRRFINCTVIFAFGLAALLSWAVERGVPRALLVALAGVAVLWEGGLALQYAVWTSAQREAGLVWPDVLAGQARALLDAPLRVWRFLFDRASFYRSTPAP